MIQRSVKMPGNTRVRVKANPLPRVDMQRILEERT